MAPFKRRGRYRTGPCDHGYWNWGPSAADRRIPTMLHVININIDLDLDPSPQRPNHRRRDLRCAIMAHVTVGGEGLLRRDRARDERQGSGEEKGEETVVCPFLFKPGFGAASPTPEQSAPAAEYAKPTVPHKRRTAFSPLHLRYSKSFLGLDKEEKNPSGAEGPGRSFTPAQTPHRRPRPTGVLAS